MGNGEEELKAGVERKRWSPGVRAKVLTLVIPVAVLVLVGYAMRGGGGGVAPMPSVFDPSVTLASATAAAKGSDKPVLVFATADWCGPCQVFKRGALADERVATWIREHTWPVYLDIDKSKNDAAALGVRAIPCLILLKGESIVDMIDGAHEADVVLEWLKQVR